MKNIENIKTLAQVQQEFAPSKDVKAFNYTYSNLPVILQTLKDIGASYTLVLKSTELMEHSKFEQSFKNGIKLQFQAIIKTTWIFTYEGMEPQEVSIVSSGTQDDLDKAFGSAVTYARRYVLMSVFNANDGGSFDPEQKEQPTQKQPQPKEQPIRDYKKLLDLYIFYNPDFLKGLEKTNPDWRGKEKAIVEVMEKQRGPIEEQIKKSKIRAEKEKQEKDMKAKLEKIEAPITIDEVDNEEADYDSIFS